MLIRYSKDALKFLNKLVLAWDPDYTKLTDAEKSQVDAAENSGFIDDDKIDWDNIGQ
jgi:hypothetical protein